MLQLREPQENVTPKVGFPQVCVTPEPAVTVLTGTAGACLGRVKPVTTLFILF